MFDETDAVSRRAGRLEAMPAPVSIDDDAKKAGRHRSPVTSRHARIGHLTAGANRCDTVLDGVLHERLEQQWRNTRVQQLRAERRSSRSSRS